MSRPILSILAVLTLALAVGSANDKSKTPAREALRPLNELIGGWKGVGEPEGTPAEKQRGFWRETVNWGWKFQGDDAWLVVTFTNGKHFKQGELRYVPDKDQYVLDLVTKDGKKQTFAGQLTKNGRSLVLERFDPDKKETQRLTFNLVGEIRFVYIFDYKPENRKQFVKAYQVASTKEGESFGSKEKKPECIVSGGLGTMTVSHQGMTYYVCCTGCRDEFLANPEKYIKEFNEKKAKEGK